MDILFIRMLQGREERGNLIPALLPGIPRLILEVFSGSDGAQGLSPSVQFQEGERAAALRSFFLLP